MSNNKQSSVEKMFEEMLGIQQEGIQLTFDENLLLLEKYKAMHKDEISESYASGSNDRLKNTINTNYYNETYNKTQ